MDEKSFTEAGPPDEVPETMVEEFSARLYSYLARNLVPGPLTYGFEYEFLPLEIMTPERVAEIGACLPGLGFRRLVDGSYGAADGLHIDFEPGGQLEYGSPPLLGGSEKRFRALLDHLVETNARIEELCGVRYEARAYLPGRVDAPLCLTSSRYRAMHELFTANGGRGREMMKATASIQLHVRIRSFAEMVPLFLYFQELARDPEFRMSPERREIWDTTEPSRCLLPEICGIKSELELLFRLVEHALQALDLETGVPFCQLEKPDFAAFLVHLTTIFTDVRLKLKGPTFELRTMDSLPAAEFARRWRRFIAGVEALVARL